MRRLRIFVVMVLGALSMAPTVGDVGGCGKTATLLDPAVYAYARKGEDCKRCQDCGITNVHCTNACDANVPPEVDLPITCKPLYHDGEVCLRALDAASCEKYETYVSDVAPALPTECDFCHVAPPQATPGFVDDAGEDASP